MTRTFQSDSNSRQVAESNSDLRHLIRNSSNLSHSGFAVLVPIRYLLSTTYSHFKMQHAPGEVQAGLLVLAADTHRTPSQPVPDRGVEVASNCHATTHSSDTSTGGL